MIRRQVIIGAAAMATLTACGEAIDKGATSRPPAQVVTLDDKLTALKAAFNANAGKVRLLFVAGPSCGPCLRGLIDLDKALGRQLLSDPRLKVFVVYVPTLSAELKHATRASRLIGGTSVEHFWDASGHTGDVLQKTLGLNEYAWDVWLTYGPDQHWTDDVPPKPDVWSHQLEGITIAPFLDAKKVAADVRSRVERIG